MDDGIDLVVRDQRGNQRLVARLADDQRRPLRPRPIEAGRELVEHDHALARIDEGMNHVATDIAAAAGDEDGHAYGSAEKWVADRYAKPVKIRLAALNAPLRGR